MTGASDLATEFGNQAAFFSLNSDENPEVTREYRISGIPTYLFFKNFECIARLVGYQGVSALRPKIAELIQD